MGLFDDVLAKIEPQLTAGADAAAKAAIDNVLSKNGVVTAPATAQATQAAATNNVVKAGSISLVGIAVIGVVAYFLFKKSRV